MSTNIIIIQTQAYSSEFHQISHWNTDHFQERMNDITSHIHQCRTNDTVQYDCTTHLTHVVLTEICSVPVRRRAGKSVYKLTYFVSSRILNLNSINQLAKQEAFEKCWTHSPQRAPHANSLGVATVLLHAARASMSTTQTTTTRERGDRDGPMEWVQ